MVMVVFLVFICRHSLWLAVPAASAPPGSGPSSSLGQRRVADQQQNPYTTHTLGRCVWSEGLIHRPDGYRVRRNPRCSRCKDDLNVYLHRDERVDGGPSMAVLFPDREAEMGSVSAMLTISNIIDKARADAGEIAASDVRSF